MHDTVSDSALGVLPESSKHFGVVEVESQELLSPQPQTPVAVLHLLATPLVRIFGRHEPAVHYNYKAIFV